MAVQVPGAEWHGTLMHDAADEAADGTPLEVSNVHHGMYSVAVIQVVGISGDTITWEGTVNGTTWVAIPFTNLNTGTAANTATADGIYRATVTGLAYVQARISTYSAGVITATGVAVA